MSASRSAATPDPAKPTHSLFLGTSGWAYTSWKPGFYPRTVPTRDFLLHYASQLNSVEVNYTFRKLPTRDQLHAWLTSVPPDFRFSFKAPQRLTHMKRLRDCEAPLVEFLDAIDPARKAGKLGLLLFQLPPNFKADPERLNNFLRLRPLRRKGLRLAFEFRHESWFTQDTYVVLRRHNAALCVAEGENLTTPDITTAGFRCYRLRKSGGYTPHALARTARQLATQLSTGDAYVYFRHEEQPTGALNAVHLRRKLTRFAPEVAS